ncbi:MAG: hypothetical protein WEC81_02020 [Patescibacteria group bacterium]
MSELKLAYLELTQLSRKSGRTSANTTSTVFVVSAVVALTILTLWLSPITYTREISQIILYSLAIIQIVFGLRVGFLKIGSRNNEYFLPLATRYWQRALPYLIIALLLPAPIVIATTTHLANGSYQWSTVFISQTTNYLMFFLIGLTGAMVIRSLVKRSIVRIIIVAIALIGTILTLSSGSFVFRSVFVNEITTYSQLFVIAGQLSVIAILIMITDLLAERLPLTVAKVGRYWPLFLGQRALGFGQGSGQFFKTNRIFLRDTQLHRRLSAIVIGLVIFISLLHVTLLVNGTAVSETLVLITLTIFSAISALVISKLAEEIYYQGTVHNLHLPIDLVRSRVGNWLISWFWQVGITVVLWGIIGSWYTTTQQLIWPLLVAATTQHLLVYGWSGKLIHARHQTLANLAVFGLTILVGVMPVALLQVTPISQTIFIQLIWLLFVGILLQLTSNKKVGDNSYA